MGDVQVVADSGLLRSSHSLFAAHANKPKIEEDVEEGAHPLKIVEVVLARRAEDKVHLAGKNIEEVHVRWEVLTPLARPVVVAVCYNALRFRNEANGRNDAASIQRLLLVVLCVLHLIIHSTDE